MPRKESPRSDDRRHQDAEPDSDGQSGYGAGDGGLDGAGAWSGRANPKNASPGSGPVPNEGALRTSARAEGSTKARGRTKTKPASAATKRGRKR
jgi:hypothetical protein